MCVLTKTKMKQKQKKQTSIFEKLIKIWITNRRHLTADTSNAYGYISTHRENLSTLNVIGNTLLSQSLSF